MTFVLLGIVFLMVWGATSYDTKEQNAVHVAQGFAPKSQVEPFAFTVLYLAAAIGLYWFLFLR